MLNTRFLFLIVLLNVIAANLNPLIAKDNVPRGRLSSDVLPQHYHLKLKIDPAKERFSGKATIDINIKKNTKELYLHGIDLNIFQSTLINQQGEKLPITISKTPVNGVLKIQSKQGFSTGKFQLSIDYDAPFNTNLQGLYSVKDGNNYYAFTQFESIFARYAFPSFDEPAFKTPYDIEMTIPTGMKGIANTPLISSKPGENGWKVLTFATTKPIPSYLLAVAVGDFDIVSEKDIPANAFRTRTIPLRGITTKGKGKQIKYALSQTGSEVEALEDYFQIPYPYQKLDIIAVPDFEAGAMENPGAITFREQLLLFGKNPSIAQKRRSRSVQAHELAHQWFGDLVTPVWWNDIWLNEAFATWMAATAQHRKWPNEHWLKDLISRSKTAMTSDAIPSARKIRNPILSNSDIVTAFDGITYSKGGGVLSMMEHYMGEENFRLGVRKYLKKFAWKNATALDFFENIASVLPKEQAKLIETTFKDFVTQAGVPLINIESTCKQNQTFLNLSQSRYFPLGTQSNNQQTWHVPVCLKYQIGDSIYQQCHLLSKKTSQIKLDHKGCSDWIMPNVNALGYYRFNLNTTDWQSLIKQLKHFNGLEVNAVLDSFQAGLKAGKISIAQFLKIVPLAVNSDSTDLKLKAISFISTLVKDTTQPEKQRIRKYAIKQFRPLADNLSILNNTPQDKRHPIETSRLRTSLMTFMADTLKDKHYRELFSEKAKSIIGYKTQIDPQVLLPSLNALALKVAVPNLDRAFSKALLKNFQHSKDATFRARALSALANTRDKVIAKKLLAMSLGDAVRDNERRSLISNLFENKKLDKEVWPWFVENFSTIVKSMPTNFQKWLPFVISFQCNDESNNRMKHFLKPQLGKLIGADRNYVKAMDLLKQCKAFKSFANPQIKQIFAAD